MSGKLAVYLAMASAMLKVSNFDAIYGQIGRSQSGTWPTRQKQGKWKRQRKGGKK